MIRSRSNSTPVDEPLDPAIQAELDQLDAALRGDPIEDDQLAALVRDVQATAPELPSDLRKQLRHDVETGFGRRGVRGTIAKAAGLAGQSSRNPQIARRRSAVFSGGLAATLLLLVGVSVVGLSQVGGGQYDDAAVSTKRDAGEPVLQSRSPEPETVTPAAGGTAPADTLASPTAPESTEQGGSTEESAAASTSSGAATPATGKRRVEQSVDMTVRVKSGELDEAAGKVETIVRQGRGYVAESRVSLQERGAGGATFTLRVASSELDRTMERLADLGTVTSQDQAARDITSRFDSVEQRLADNKEVRASLLKTLAKAETDAEIASLNQRLADNREGRESLERQLAQLRNRTDQSTIALSLNAPSGDEDGGWSLGDAASGAGHALSTVTGVLLVGGAVLLPFALLAAAAWALYRVRRSRARESVLDD